MINGVVRLMDFCSNDCRSMNLAITGKRACECTAGVRNEVGKKQRVPKRDTHNLDSHINQSVAVWSEQLSLSF